MKWSELYEVSVQFFTCTWVAVGTIVYVCGLLKEQSCTSIQALLGRGRSIQADVR
jgi:hypothetical protein